MGKKFGRVRIGLKTEEQNVGLSSRSGFFICSSNRGKAAGKSWPRSSASGSMLWGWSNPYL